MITTSLIIELAALGICTGFVAGLLGIGGGGIMVPFLSAILIAHGMGTGIAVKMAIATSMAVIIFTSISSVRQHWKLGNVRWDIFLTLTPGIIAGGLIASIGVFSLLEGTVIAIIFSVFLFAVATRMFLNKKPKPGRDLPKKPGLVSAGAGIGFISSIVGIGGGSLSVPFMSYCNVPIHKAVGTSAALGFPIAITGVTGYIIASYGLPGLPDLSIGYIWLPALAAMAICTVITAPIGARVASHLPVKRLKQIFAIMLYILSIYMLYQAITG